MHYHDYFQLCFVTCGVIEHQQEGNTVPLCAGDAFIIPPGFAHSVHFRSADAEMYSLAFAQTLFHPGFQQSHAYSFLRSLQRDPALLGGNLVRLRVVLDQEQQKTVRSLMECLLRQQQAQIPPELSAAPSLITAALYVLAQSYFRQPRNALQLDTLPDDSGAMQQCIRYLDENFRLPVDFSSLTRQFGISRSVFYARFSQLTGLSPKRYVAQKRVLQAQVLIRSGQERSLVEIAGEVGYEDFSSFYRNFVRLTGVTPSQYRLLCGKETE